MCKVLCNIYDSQKPEAGTQLSGIFHLFEAAIDNAISNIKRLKLLLSLF